MANLDINKESQPSVSISSIKAINTYLIAQQHCVDRLWANTSLHTSCLDDPDLRIPLSDYFQVWNNALETSGDAALGLHIGEQSDSSSMGLVANVLIHEESFGDSLHQYARLYSLVNDGIQLELIEGQKTSALYFKHLDPTYYKIQDIERTLAICLTRTRLFIQKDIQLSRVGFAHSQQDYHAEYQRIFNCPVEFNQDTSFLEIDNELLKHAPSGKNPYTRSALLNYSNRALNKINRKRFSNQVRNHIIDLLQHKKADVDEVAKRLHMSRHTLYRKLKLEDVAFQDLVEEIRKEKAIAMVQEPQPSLSEVAFLLGFSELSSFSRAFKRWTGKSPKQFRNA